MRDVSILIVNFNGKHFLNDCLDSIYKQNYRDYEVILIDNSSSDGSVGFVKKNFPKTRVIRNKVNNYTQSLNKGIRECKSKFFVTLNNDTKVGDNWLQELVNAINRNLASAVQSKVLLQDGRINGVGIVELPNFNWRLEGFGERDNGQYDIEKEIMVPYGACTIYDKKNVLDVGGFDEDFEHHVDEIDLAYRLRRKGHKIFFAPKSIVFHRYQGSHSERDFTYYTERNRLYYVAKYFPAMLSSAVATSNLFYSFEPDEYRMIYEILPLVVKKLVRHHKNCTAELQDLVESQKIIFDFLHHKFTLKQAEDKREYAKSLKDIKANMMEENRLLKIEFQNRINEYQQRENTYNQMIEDFKKTEEQLKFVNEKLEREIRRLNLIIRGFYNSRGYKYILKPIDKLYRALLR